MEAAAADRRLSARVPSWLLGLLPLAIIAVAIGAFALLDAPGVTKRLGPPVEELSVERTVLRPGTIELTVRNAGPDAVTLAQVTVNDGFADFRVDHPKVGRLGRQRIAVTYPWIEGEAYDVGLLSATGATVTHQIPVAVETPDPGGLLGLMALLGLYVGVIPIALGMLWLPWLRRVPPAWMRVLMAITVGLLGWLAVDAGLEGLDVAGTGAGAFGGPALVVLGAFIAYGALTGIGAWLKGRRSDSSSAGTLALLVAIGIGLHNLGEGLAIGSAYAVGALALGTSLVVGFALHNTTEGLAIVAPLSKGTPTLKRLLLLGTLAGAPAILGAWVGASAFQPAIASVLLGFGVGAIVQVIVQLRPTLRDGDGQIGGPAVIAGLLGGVAIMFLTGLLV
jgi:zinc transporter ZupT